MQNLGLITITEGSDICYIKTELSNDTTFTIEKLLRENKADIYMTSYLKRYYLQYIDNKKKKEQETTNLSDITIDSNTLSELKNQLSYLISMKKGLEQQIISLQQHIETFEGRKTNGRK